MSRRSSSKRSHLGIYDSVSRVIAVKRLLCVKHYVSGCFVVSERILGKRNSCSGRIEMRISKLEEELNEQVGVMVIERTGVSREVLQILSKRHRIIDTWRRRIA